MFFRKLLCNLFFCLIPAIASKSCSTRLGSIPTSAPNRSCPAAGCVRVPPNSPSPFNRCESGHVLAVALDRKQRTNHLREIVTLLTTLWTSSVGKTRGADYSEQEAEPTPHRPALRLPVRQHRARHLWNALASSNTADGTLSRYLVFKTPLNHPDIQRPAALADGLDEIVAAFQAIAAGVPAEGNLVGYTIAPHVVPLTPGAERADQALAADQLAQLRASDETDRPVRASANTSAASP